MRNNQWGLDDKNQWPMTLAILAFIVFALAVLLPSCGPYQPGPPVNPEAGTADDCPAACANLERLECPGWEGSPGYDDEAGTADDIPCVEVCEELLEEPTMTLFPICTSKATSCEEVDACFK